MNYKNRKIRTTKASNPEKFFQEGIQLQAAGKHAKARDIYTRLIRAYPKNVTLHNRLGQVTFALGDYESSVIHFKNSLDCNPEQAETLANMGVAYRRLRRYDLALECQNKALSINPTHANAYNNLGILLNEAFNKNSEALIAFDRALEINPNFADAYFNKGNVLKSQNLFDEAISSYRRAIDLNPHYGSAIANLAIALGAKKNYQESIRFYQQAVEMGVDINFLQGQFIYTKLHVADWSGLDIHLKNLKNAIVEKKPVIAPFATLALLDDPAIQQRAIETFMSIEYPPKSDLVAPSTHPEHKRIKIGYFSSDYWNHPVTHLILGLFAAHDRNFFEVIAFGFGKPPNDKWNQRIRQACDQYIDVTKLTDIEVANLSRSMEIDIAVDLNGYTEKCRTGIFVQRAAPIQVSYIGYLGTMAAPYIDYLIADQLIVPMSSRQYYTEKLIYLPTYQCNDPEQKPSQQTISRSAFGLPEDAFVYCAFNNNYKITPQVFEIWMRILNRVPQGVLWLFVNNEKAQENLRLEAKFRGVNPERIVFAKKVPLEEHLARQRLGDLFLDTLPYNAGATASNALRVGLPVLTRTGESFAGRMGSSLLKSVGLEELITTSETDYENKAVEMASNPLCAQRIRRNLEENLIKSPLFDNKLFAKNIEAAYQAIHQRACNGLQPIHILVQ